MNRYSQLVKSSTWAIGMIAATCVVPAAAWGQAFGQRNLGGTVSAGNRSFTTGGNPSGGLGAGGGTTGIGAGSTMADQSSVGQISGSERFMRDQRQAGQFVGADSGENTGLVGAVQSGAGGQLGGQNMGLGGLGQGGLGQGGFGNQRGNQQQLNQFGGNQMGGRGGMGQTAIRPTLAIDFQYTAIPSAQVATALTVRLDRITQLNRLSPLTVTLENGVAVLRGAVATERDRDLAVRLVRLEPGVRDVVSELTIGEMPAPGAGE